MFICILKRQAYTYVVLFYAHIQDTYKVGDVSDKRMDVAGNSLTRLYLNKFYIKFG